VIFLRAIGMMANVKELASILLKIIRALMKVPGRAISGVDKENSFSLLEKHMREIEKTTKCLDKENILIKIRIFTKVNGWKVKRMVKAR
jgi:hypothetical protein